MSPHRRLPVLLAVLVVLGIASPLVAVPPASAAARPAAQSGSDVTAQGPRSATAAQNDGTPSLRVVIDTFTPDTPTAGATLTITGRVISAADVPLTDVSVQLRKSSAPLRTRTAIGTVYDAGLDPQDGEPTDVPLPGTRVPLAAQLPPGSRRSFTIKVGIDALGLGAPGSYALAVEALGRETGVDEFDARKGIVRTFLPWMPPDAQIPPVQLVWLWPLSDWPDRAADGTLLSDQTPRALAPGGRLERLVVIGSRQRSTVSWITDPALLQTAADMSDGYEVRQNGSLVVGKGETNASRWLTLLRQTTRDVGLRSIPYADVDASALTRGGLSNDVVRAVTQGPGIASAALGEAVPGNLYWAPFGRIDRPTLNVLASSGVSTIVLSANAMPATDKQASTLGLATTSIPTSVGSMQAVLTDPGLTNILSLPQGSASDVILARQRFLAETATAAQVIPADQSSRVLVVSPDSVRWRATASLITPLLRATNSASWLKPLTLEQLLAAPVPSTSRKRGGYGERARDAELPEDYINRIAGVSNDLDVFSSVLDDPTGVVQPFAEALLRTESAAWRGEVERGTALLASVNAGINAQVSRVRVLSEGQITFSGDTGKVPVTITNELDRSVTVGLTLRGHPAVRLSSTPLSGIRIDPGKFASVDIEARVVGGEPLLVDVQLLSPEGDPYGDPPTITVVSTAYARAASWVVAAAFVAIVIFVIVGVLRRIHEARAARKDG
ncbi:MAG: hypothetical protein GC156_00525 [Actinomycetales bacterium]|nr:hypothetical protein [Actinomycetales bacterium]